jgi:hypothetical protein
MTPQLGFDQAPPIGVPFRFFLTAPIFLAAAGLLLAWVGPQAALSRWAPATLAFVHLLTAGFMLQVMLGALFQFLPVAVGTRIARVAALAAGVHLATAIGAALLAAAFLSASTPLAWLAAALLAGGIGTFVVVVGATLWPRPATSATATALKIALAGLALTAGLGVALLLARVSATGLPARVTDLHAGWGLIGWSGLLIAGVAYVVVPMFQITPAYPPRFVRAFAPAVAAILGGWSLAVAFDFGGVVLPAAALLAVLAAAFAGVTLRLQAKSRRPRADVTVRYWRVGLVALLLASAAVAATAGGLSVPPLAAGALVLVGFYVSLISGMLYKIVPFLCWLHAQQRAMAAGVRAPHMGIFLGESPMRGQFWLQLAATLLLVAASLYPAAPVRLAGALLASAGLWLAINLLRAARRYRQAVAAIAIPA